MCGCSKGKRSQQARTSASRRSSNKLGRLARATTNSNNAPTIQSTIQDKEKLKVQKLRRQAILRALGHI